MSAAELLKRVSALPARERKKFFEAFLALEEAPRRHSNGNDKRVAWPDVEARARRIFGGRVSPNLVLLERDQAAQ